MNNNQPQNDQPIKKIRYIIIRTETVPNFKVKRIGPLYSGNDKIYLSAVEAIEETKRLNFEEHGKNF